MKHDKTAVVEHFTVWASVDTILLFDTLKHKDLLFIMDITNAQNIAIFYKILYLIKNFQYQTKNEILDLFGHGPFDSF